MPRKLKDKLRNEIFPAPGLVNLGALEAELVRQDEELRDRCLKAATLPGLQADRIESMLAALLDSQLAIHERLGNMLMMPLQQNKI